METIEDRKSPVNLEIYLLHTFGIQNRSFAQHMIDKYGAHVINTEMYVALNCQKRIRGVAYFSINDTMFHLADDRGLKKTQHDKLKDTPALCETARTKWRLTHPEIDFRGEYQRWAAVQRVEEHVPQNMRRLTAPIRNKKAEAQRRKEKQASAAKDMKVQLQIAQNMLKHPEKYSNGLKRGVYNEAKKSLPGKIENQWQSYIDNMLYLKTYRNKPFRNILNEKTTALRQTPMNYAVIDKLAKQDAWGMFPSTTNAKNAQTLEGLKELIRLNKNGYIPFDDARKSKVRKEVDAILRNKLTTVFDKPKNDPMPLPELRMKLRKKREEMREKLKNTIQSLDNTTKVNNNDMPDIGPSRFAHLAGKIPESQQRKRYVYFEEWLLGNMHNRYRTQAEREDQLKKYEARYHQLANKFKTRTNLPLHALKPLDYRPPAHARYRLLTENELRRKAEFMKELNRARKNIQEERKKRKRNERNDTPEYNISPLGSNDDENAATIKRLKVKQTKPPMTSQPKPKPRKTKAQLAEEANRKFREENRKAYAHFLKFSLPELMK
jgi:hypothetical protein